MLAVMGVVAVWSTTASGSRVLRKGWVNLDSLWAGAFVVAGVITFFT